MALGTLNRSVSDVDMIDQFYLDHIRLFHCMDRFSRPLSVFTVLDELCFQKLLYPKKPGAYTYHPEGGCLNRRIYELPLLNGIKFMSVP